MITRGATPTYEFAVAEDFGYSINSSGTLTVRRRYNSNYSLTINGTYVTEVYALDPPSGVTLFT